MGTQVYRSMAGDWVNQVAAEMCRIASMTGDDVESDFNGITLKAWPGCQLETVVNGYNIESARRRKAYEESEVGKAEVRRQEAKLIENQKSIDDAMAELDSLDFTHNSHVMSWFEKIRAATDYVGVITPADEILEKFASHGWHPNVNTGAAFNEEDEDNYARYVVGQALECLTATSWGPRAIHQIFDTFAERWRVKFNYVKSDTDRGWTRP